AAALVISCCVIPSRARGEEHQQLTPGDYGRFWYEKYCTPCHGKGGAPGSAVFSDSKERVDLRVYVQRHGGFPSSDWLAVVFGDPVTTVHSAVWQRIQKDKGAETADGETAAHGTVAIIADYVR